MMFAVACSDWLIFGGIRRINLGNSFIRLRHLHLTKRCQFAQEQKQSAPQASTSRKDLTTEQHGSIIQKIFEEERSRAPQTTTEKGKYSKIYLQYLNQT